MMKIKKNSSIHPFLCKLLLGIITMQITVTSGKPVKPGKTISGIEAGFRHFKKRFPQKEEVTLEEESEIKKTTQMGQKPFSYKTGAEAGFSRYQKGSHQRLLLTAPLSDSAKKLLRQLIVEEGRARRLIEKEKSDLFAKIIEESPQEKVRVELVKKEVNDVRGAKIVEFMIKQQQLSIIANEATNQAINTEEKATDSKNDALLALCLWGYAYSLWHAADIINKVLILLQLNEQETSELIRHGLHIKDKSQETLSYLISGDQNRGTLVKMAKVDPRIKQGIERLTILTKYFSNEKNSPLKGVLPNEQYTVWLRYERLYETQIIISLLWQQLVTILSQDGSSQEVETFLRDLAEVESAKI